ncbi:dehydrogenase [Kwoniella mangroviensis CBS 10435]|uniref:Dehydrogenase n=1 Tax=Kwoniella mangroviensis CBS 10435 TaxID=1331196 RepID=A0A1B9IV84_9TREE|nr:dehydrogenase [Kwoniella mangroviensis CBS 8507]OCF59433.1 dehydrogenase [Kwoniella mangroviensis CBS 10435]OCF66404.1 dehydrogenase [Kwoniella mangroviensis CBS 8507]OCF73542.1 dehydrogenase [Kwoniella mangroviensis CBS 8886]
MSVETFPPISVGLMGTGEYTTGITPSGQSKSDKKIGVVGVTMFDLRRRGKVSDIVMAGTNGGKFPEIKQHFQKNIGDVYKGLDLSFKGFPEGNLRNAEAYKEALRALPKGSAVIIFTPDSTHFPIASEALNLGHHVLVTKPATQKLEDHQKLIDLAEEKGLVCFVEHHKRFDPAYNDARARAQKLGDFNFYSSYMSQPKMQLETFKSWAGIDSDISYYLNSHHIDIHCWMVEGRYKPVKVTASATTGIATSMGCDPKTEDTITLLVDWENVETPSQRGTAVYTASWAAPLKAGVHSEQRFHYMAAKGEVRVDQAHRGYSIVEDDIGKLDYNPFYVKYSPDENGYFDGQKGYGYVSLEKFIDAAQRVTAGKAKASDFDGKGLPTIKATVLTTAIIHAGRVSLDEKRSVGLVEEGGKLKLV